MSVPLSVKRLSWASALVGGTVATLTLFFCDPARMAIYPVCMFHRLTGLECPGCGGLRAMHQLLHGHLVAAFHLNAFLVLSLPLVAGWGLQMIWCEIKGRQPMTIRPAWVWVYLAAWFAFGVLRDLPFALFASFAP